MMNLAQTYTPPTDGYNSAVTALQFLYPIDSGQHVDFSQDSQMSALFTNQQEEQYKQKTQQSMGEASKAIFEPGTVTWKRSKANIMLDSKRLLSEQPELLNQFSLTRLGSRRFVISA